ncbi:MAG: CocE/NonD family hydrolase [Chloroflexota bacterium]|nr:CocE/NonD family hydrolase [Chloroflexota bacterium]
MAADWHDLVSQPKYKLKVEKNVMVPMRDGTRIAIDIYHPDARGKFPALLSTANYSKDVQALPIPKGTPIDFRLGNGGIEAGNSEYFVSRGYVHVNADARGTGFSEGQYGFLGRKEQEDGYDLIEWMAKQPWCSGNVGMLGMSYFAMIQYLIAGLNPPHLKAIFPFEGTHDIYRSFCYHGGIFDFGFFFQWWPHLTAHTMEPLDMPPAEFKRRVEEMLKNEDVLGHPNIYIPLVWQDRNPIMLYPCIQPYDGPYYQERSGYTKFDKIKIPTYCLSRWTTWLFHLPGALAAYNGINAPKKLTIGLPEASGKDKYVFSVGRPWFEGHDVILRWYDHWLKGIDTGIMEEPPINILVQGTDKWRYENEWPLARTKWTKFYLRQGGKLNQTPSSSGEEPESFVNKPTVKPSEKVPQLQYVTEPLARDLEITGPSAFYFNASLSNPDANWMVEIHDISPDGSRRLVTMGWLKASHRELDVAKSKPYQPYHPHTRSLPVEPGKIYEYAIDVRETSNVFQAGHRMQLIVKGQDSPYEGPEHFRETHYHLLNMKETKHTIYHTPQYQSYLLLPVIP